MAETKSPESARLVANRWTPTLAKMGWTPVADFFLDNYHRLNPPLKYSEAMLVIHIMRHKWDAAAPYPAFKTRATRMGISPQAARILARNLQAKGYLFREFKTGETNRFHFGKLFSALESLYAKDLLEKNKPAKASNETPAPGVHPLFSQMTPEAFAALLPTTSK